MTSPIPSHPRTAFAQPVRTSVRSRGGVRLAALLTLAALAPLAAAQDGGAPPKPDGPEASLPPSFCKWWKNLGTLYKDPENPYVQEFKVFGRLHYQYGIVDGEGSGNEFNYHADQIRRFRTGIGSKFLDHFDLYAEAEIGQDRRPRGGDFDIRFQHMWQLKLHFDAKKAFGIDELDALKVGIGSREINMSYEWVTSSKRIKTVERSAIANKIWAFNSEFANPTGAWVQVGLDPIDWTVGVFSTTQDDWLAPFDDGELYYSNLKWDLHDGPDGADTDLRWTAFHQERSVGDEVLANGLDWATAVALVHKEGPWEFAVEGIAGNNGDRSNPNREGDFWGFTVMPSYWILDNSLEAVFQFQYQGSEESQGIRLNSRYVRRAGVKDNLPAFANGRGDEQLTFYAGLNKLLCGHQHKVMFGVEYDTLSSDGMDIFRGWSAFVAYRTYW
ncbi:MAG: porin [Planctomycetota bacterium]